MNETNLQILLKRRPVGWPTEDDFERRESPVPQPAEGEFLVRNRWLSLDPYMRGRMSDAKSYARHVELGEVMVGGTVGEVVASRHPDYRPGDQVVTSTLGWQRYGVTDGEGVRKIADARVPPQAYLGVVGMPGVTAWVGLHEICRPKAGETVLVTAAAGAVGSAVGQMAKLHGCRAVGVAGGPEKCRYVVEELGFDACVDYKAGGVYEAIRAAAPNGIDCLFENVGGEIFDEALRLLNPFSRIALCGLVSQYNVTQPYGYKNLRSLLANRVHLQGFIVFDHRDMWDRAEAQLATWVAEGRIKYRETIAEGLDSAPKAFIGLLRGQNLGKQLVRVD